MQKTIQTEGQILSLIIGFYHQILDFLKQKLYFEGFGEYPGYNKECIQTNLDTEHITTFTIEMSPP